MKKLITILLLSSCNLIDPPTHVTDDLQPFVDRVVYEYNIRGVFVKPIKVILERNLGARGTYNSSPYWNRRITIDKNFFIENSGRNQFEVLKTVAHEFGHYQGREHKNEEIDHAPVSLMCTKCSVWAFKENEEYYFDELVGVKLNKE
jgi:hypothetical protein